jgi:hypothetical protein
MTKAKIMEHPLVHDEVSNEDRIIFLVTGVVVTLLVFVVMKVISI